MFQRGYEVSTIPFATAEKVEEVARITCHHFEGLNVSDLGKKLGQGDKIRLSV